MNASTLNARTRGFGLSVAITSIVSALLVIAKETNEGLLAFMKAVSVHHWVTHGVFDVLVFLVLGLALSRSNQGQGPNIADEKLITVVAAGFLLGCVAIAAFYLIAG